MNRGKNLRQFVSQNPKILFLPSGFFTITPQHTKIAAKLSDLVQLPISFSECKTGHNVAMPGGWYRL